jgi:prepilin-type N-terminal cleavage/methylation domain-containing protein
MRSRGFTLVEVLVGLVVLAVGLLALAKLSVVQVRAGTFGRLYGFATMMAQSKMEELRRDSSPNQPGTFSVYDFSYLVSTAANYTSVADPPSSTTLVTVPGLLSGSSSPAGAPVTTTGGTTYEVLYDDGTHGDASAGDGVYTCSDTLYAATGTTTAPASGPTGPTVNRVWTVQPITLKSRIDFAKLTVTTTWTDKFNVDHTTHFESMAHRRQ